jgi:transposase
VEGGRVGQSTPLAQVLGLAGVDVDLVEQETDGSWTAYVTTAAGAVACCPTCEQPAGRVKEPVGHTFAHLVVVSVRVVWHKGRWFCGNPACPRQTFAERGSVVAARAGVSASGRVTMGRLVGDWLVPVRRVAAAAGVSWHSAHDGFVAVAGGVGIQVEATRTTVAAADTAAPHTPARCDADTEPDPDTGSDLDTRPDPDAESDVDIEPGADVEPDPGTGPDPDAESDVDVVPGADVEPDPDPDPECGADIGPEAAVEPGPDVRPGTDIGSGGLPLVPTLGIDEHRRGRPVYHWDCSTKRWVTDTDRWQSIFVDSTRGGHGLLGQVEGRTRADVLGWLAAQPPAWRAAVRYVSIDMSSVFKSAARAGLLPNAQVLVDPFHVVQLATRMVDDVRRRVTYQRYGRRGRSGDLEYAIKNLLRRGAERLSKASRHKLLIALSDLDEGGRQIGAAWRTKELVRDLLALSPTRTGTTPSRHQISTALTAIFQFAGTVGQTVPEIATLATTISTWRAEITRAVATGHSNAAAEGVNRVVKLVYRSAFGLTNVANQQRRARYAASRATRPTWLPTVTPNSPQPVTV